MLELGRNRLLATELRNQYLGVIVLNPIFITFVTLVNDVIGRVLIEIEF